MAFILLFVVVSVAIPLSLEIYKNGSNNVLQNSFEDVRHLSMRIAHGRIAANAHRSMAGAVSFMQSAFLILVLLIVLGIVIKLLKLFVALLSLLFGWVLR